MDPYWKGLLGIIVVFATNVIGAFVAKILGESLAFHLFQFFWIFVSVGLVNRFVAYMNN